MRKGLVLVATCGLLLTQLPFVPAARAIARSDPFEPAPISAAKVAPISAAQPVAMLPPLNPGGPIENAIVEHFFVPNLMQLEFTFNAPMVTSGANDVRDGAHYEMDGGLFVGAGELSSDGRTVLLTLACQSVPTCQHMSSGAGYHVSIRGVADVYGNLANQAVSFTASDSTPPTVAVESASAGSFVVRASEPLAPPTAAEFSWDESGSFPGTATLQAGAGTNFCDESGADRCFQRLRFDLTTTQIPGAHSLRLNGLTDLAGNSVSTTLTVTIPSDTSAPVVDTVLAFDVPLDPTGPIETFVNVDILPEEPTG